MIYQQLFIGAKLITLFQRMQVRIIWQAVTDDAIKPSQANGSALKHQAHMSPPPAPPPQNNNLNGKEKQSVHIARADGDGIFVGDGINYLVPKKEMSQSPVSVDMDEAVLFHCIVYGPVPPSESAQARQLPLSL